MHASRSFNPRLVTVCVLRYEPPAFNADSNDQFSVGSLFNGSNGNTANGILDAKKLTDAGLRRRL